MHITVLIKIFIYYLVRGLLLLIYHVDSYKEVMLETSKLFLLFKVE